jgi:hypothetical protein
MAAGSCSVQIGRIGSVGLGRNRGIYRFRCVLRHPEVIQRVKSAAALRDTTASLVLEEAAKEWLDRHPDGKK